MPVDANAFRAVLGQWPTGVAVVTTADEAGWHGLTASSFASVSLDPPLVSVCIARSTPAHDRIAAGGNFAVNILGKDSVELGKRFAGGRPAAERFGDLAAAPVSSGAPVLADALGWVDCELYAAHPAGDHTIFVGHVVAADVPNPTAPLVYHSRAWGQFADVLPEAATIVVTATAEPLSGDTGTALLRVLVDAGVDRIRLPRGQQAVDGLVASRIVHDVADLETARADGISLAELDDPALVSTTHDCGLAARVLVPDAFAGPQAVTAVARATASGADEICLQGEADPLGVRRVLQDVVGRTGRARLAVSIDDVNPFGIANALTALKSGVSILDVGVGGSDARLPAEDVVQLLERLGVQTTVSRAGLVRVEPEQRALSEGVLT